MKIKCPSCLADIQEAELGDNGYTCPRPTCQRPIPPSYVADYRQHPPVIVSAVGLRGHGKTVYFASLFRALYLMTERWPEFYHTPLDDAAMLRVKEEAERLEQGELPAPTPFNPNNPPDPVLVRVSGIPLYSGCTLLFYDASGESFTADMGKLGSYVPFLQQARTVMFLVSAPDLSPQPAQAMKELLSRYIGGMRHQRVNTRQQQLAVVYTKADQMDFTASRWQALDTYLRQGLGDGLEDPESYRQKMVWASDQLREYTRQQLKAYQFLAMAGGNFERVTFSVISALGTQPETRENGQQSVIEISPVPCRIMDPLLWIVENARPAWRQGLWWKRNRWKIAALWLVSQVLSLVCSVTGIFVGIQVGANLANWSAPWQWAALRPALEVSAELGAIIAIAGVLLISPVLFRIVKPWLD
ncbi:MAG: hypothetical protein JW850_23985 [Thermoflexales bacterium]|nr:hypothetical protein [Thermoflexales bacterium]